MNFKTLVICLVAVASFGQDFNFDDYFEDLSAPAPDITQTVQTEMPTTMIVTTTTTIETTPIPTETTPIPTKTTQRTTTTTTTMMPTVSTMTTTKIFDANDTIHIRFQPSVFSLLEQLVNQAFERLEKNLIIYPQC